MTDHPTGRVWITPLRADPESAHDCPWCGGTGVHPYNELVKCPGCEGRRVMYWARPTAAPRLEDRGLSDRERAELVAEWHAAWRASFTPRDRVEWRLMWIKDRELEFRVATVVALAVLAWRWVRR